MRGRGERKEGMKKGWIEGRKEESELNAGMKRKGEERKTEESTEMTMIKRRKVRKKEKKERRRAGKHTETINQLTHLIQISEVESVV